MRYRKIKGHQSVKTKFIFHSHYQKIFLKTVQREHKYQEAYGKQQDIRRKFYNQFN